MKVYSLDLGFYFLIIRGFFPVPKKYSGPVVQLVRTPACHAGGRGFEPLLGRHLIFCFITYAKIAQSVEQWTENIRVGGSIAPQGTMCAVVAQW